LTFILPLDFVIFQYLSFELLNLTFISYQLSGTVIRHTSQQAHKTTGQLANWLTGKQKKAGRQNE